MYAVRRMYVSMLVLAVAVMWGAPGLLEAAREPRGGTGALIASTALGAALCLTPAWRMIRHMSTFLHELSHAVVAVLAGGRVHRITYSPDASGLATYSLPNNFGRIRRVLAAGAGYCGPGAAGVVMTVAIRQDLARAWLLFCAASAAVALLIMVRSMWGVLYSAVLSVVLWGAGSQLDGGLVNLAAAAVAGMMLLGGVRGALVQQRAHDLSESDAGSISRETYLPARFVATVHTATAAALVAVGFAVISGALAVT